MEGRALGCGAPNLPPLVIWNPVGIENRPERNSKMPSSNLPLSCPARNPCPLSPRGSLCDPQRPVSLVLSHSRHLLLSSEHLAHNCLHSDKDQIPDFIVRCLSSKEETLQEWNLSCWEGRKGHLCTLICPCLSVFW